MLCLGQGFHGGMIWGHSAGMVVIRVHIVGLGLWPGILKEVAMPNS